MNAEAMVSHAFSLDDYGEALEMFRSGSGRKVQIRPQAATRWNSCSTQRGVHEVTMLTRP